MKLHLLSDLHLEFCQFNPVPAAVAAADAVLLAGDIASGVQAFGWAEALFKGVRVLYTPGNHERYGWEYSEWLAAARAEEAKTANVTMLEADTFLLTKDGEPSVRVIGTTLWTDFDLYGAELRKVCGPLTQRVLADFRHIRVGSRLLSWEATRELHLEALEWLKQQCVAARRRGEKVVVMSHHAPSLRSSSAKYKKDLVTAGFASNLEAFAAECVDVWVHGHMHNSSSYQLGNCRVVANPRGYPLSHNNQDTTFENPGFNSGLILEV